MNRLKRSSLMLLAAFVCAVLSAVAMAATPQPFNNEARAAILAATAADDAPYVVRLESRVFLPRDRAEIAASGAEKAFVQFRRTLRGEERDALVAAGIVFHETLEPFTYLASVPKSAVATLQGHPLFRGVEPIAPSDKVTASLFLRDIPEHARRVGGQAAVFFRFYENVALAEALAALDGAGVSVQDRDSFLFGNRLEGVANPGRILAACESPLVRAAFEIPPPPVTSNAQAAGFSNVPPLNIAPYGLNGSGVVVGLWDGGPVRTTHQDLTPRVTLKEVAQPVSDHATHVVGTILGTGFGNAAARGMASSATAFSFDFFGDVPTEQATSSQLPPAVNGDGIVLSNNSWVLTLGWRQDPNTCFWSDGPETSFGAYDSGSQTWDELVRKKRFVVVKSSGNEGNDCGPAGTCANPRNTDCDGVLGSDGFRYDVIDPIGIAKNVLTVGALNDDGLTKTSFSSAGPADDGRVKPDVVANGLALTSSGSGADNQYVVKSGTSMAAPVVSGVVALIDEAWKNLHPSRSPALNKPTPELVKALLINTATDLGRPGPDYAYGHGLVRGKEAVDALQAPNAAGQSALAPSQVRIGFISEGEVLNYRLSTPAAGSTGQLKTTVVWDDAGGTSASVVRYCNYVNFKNACNTNADCVSGPAVCLPAPCGAVPCNLKNDLETLLYNVGGTAIIGQAFVPPGVASLTGNAFEGANHLDNVETILKGPYPSGGDFPLKVFGFTVSGGQQRFALVANKPLTFLPQNDNFANAKTLPALLAPDPAATDCASGENPCPATLYQHNTWDSVNFDATLEAGEPLVAAGNTLHSVWFKWVAPANGLAVFDTAGADFDTLLGVYTGNSVGALTLVAQNDDTYFRQSSVSFTATAGTTYRIAVSGYKAPSDDRSMGVFPLNYYLKGVCGNSTVDIGETCDDGNTSAGDCCSASCAYEAGGSACNVGGSACAPGSCNGAGACIAGAPLDCNDANVCTTDSCSPATGCVHANNAAACDDGNACTTADTCGGGLCVGGPPPGLPDSIPTLTMQNAARLTWAPPPGASGYDVVRGDLPALRSSGGDFTTSTVECLANDQSVTQLDYAGLPGPGTGFFFLVRGANCSGSGTYDTAGPRQVGSRDAEVDAAPITCGTSCTRDKCLEGPAFDQGCGGCVASVCAADSFCCDNQGGGWDATCIAEVRSVCQSLTCAESAGTCAHTLCTAFNDPARSPLISGCDDPPVSPSCVAVICAADPYCCDTTWDQTCVDEVASICGKNCN